MEPTLSGNAVQARVDGIRDWAAEQDKWRRKNAYFYRELHRQFKWYIPPGRSVLEIGCGDGALLSALQPSRGMGVETDSHQAERARRNHPGLSIVQRQYHRLEFDETFDYVIVCNSLGRMADVQAVFESAHGVCRPDTRLIIANFNALWEPALSLASRLGLRRPVETQNWLSTDDVRNLLHLSQFELINIRPALLAPKFIPWISTLLNRCVANSWPFRELALVTMFHARPIGLAPRVRRPTCSVVVPTHNERGNIEAVVRRTPQLGAETELVFVDGDSDDGTPEEIERQMAVHQDRRIAFVRQGRRGGKGDAVRKAFAHATGDILMILDADLTVPPEDLPKFYDALVANRGEFINGTRLVYPLEQGAMPFLNKCANKFFSVIFSHLLNQRFRDTLCGTKVLWRKDYECIAAGRGYFGEFDPFGDFDLIFGAARADLRILEIPVRYRSRTYGKTSIRRFRDGWLLLKMSWVALWKLKWV